MDGFVRYSCNAGPWAVAFWAYRFEKPRRYERLYTVVLLKINGLPVLDRSCCAVSVASEAETGLLHAIDMKTEIWNAFFLFTAVTGQNLSLLAV